MGEHPALPQDEYGWEKLVAERLCARYRKEYGIETRIAERLAYDLASGDQVPLEQAGRDAEHVADVVEPEAGIIGRQGASKQRSCHSL